MYTSGTTGNPKGVMLKHGSIVSSVSTIPTFFTLTSNDRHISYLPLAHIFEIGVEAGMILYGAQLGFFQNNVRKLTEDWVALKPTFLAGVPRVFGRVYQQVMAQVSNRNCIVRYVFNKYYNYQCEQVRYGKPLDPGYDKKVFSSIRGKVGLDQVRLVLTGSAPCPPYLLEFLSVVLHCPILQGYGMTESALAISCSRVDDHLRGHCGPPLPHNEIRLEDVEDMGYTSKNDPQTGEICFRGPNVFSGYYKNDKESAETIDAGML
jgi:long-chain acyl-CoA synthetase